MKIQDAGLKLGGARKDTAEAHTSLTQTNSSVSLECLWPRPGDWRELITSIGADRACMCMVLYENLAPEPFAHPAIRLTLAQMTRLYVEGIRVLRHLALERLDLSREQVRDAFAKHMCSFAAAQFPAEPTRLHDLAIYAVGKAHKRTVKHPFSFTPINGMRFNFLASIGWGVDERVKDSHAYGPLAITYTKGPKRGQSTWRAVKGIAGAWEYLDKTDFPDQASALSRAIELFREHLDKEEIKKSSPKAPVVSPDWVRPQAEISFLREGFNETAKNKTAQDLVTECGFRGVEFGNWVSQKQRQWFVDAAMDAFGDLTSMMGFPLHGASLFGTLGLGYGSRGEGLKRTAAHFEPSAWVISLTKVNGPGCIAHEMGHALDAYSASMIFKMKAGSERFASECEFFIGGFHNNALATAFAEWDQAIRTQCPQWLLSSRNLDRGRHIKYWSSPSELFARGFEVMVSEAMQLKGRRNSMLVHGVREQDLADVKSGSNPYPMGEERIAACRQMAKVVRCLKASINP